MKLSDTRYEELLEQATVDCYDEEEEFAGILATLEDVLDYPLHAMLAGESVTVREIDSQRSSLRRGILAVAERNGKSYTVSLADLVFEQLDPESDEWLAMVRRWAQ